MRKLPCSDSLPACGELIGFLLCLVAANAYSVCWLVSYRIIIGLLDDALVEERTRLSLQEWGIEFGTSDRRWRRAQQWLISCQLDDHNLPGRFNFSANTH